MTKIIIKPLTVNQAWRGGRRFRTKTYLQYEKDFLTILPRPIKMIKGWVEIKYHFYLKYYKTTDTSNLIKCLEDIIVKAGLIEDDRKVIKFSAEKHPSNEDYLEFEIKQCKSIK